VFCGLCEKGKNDFFTSKDATTGGGVEGVSRRGGGIIYLLNGTNCFSGWGGGGKTSYFIIGTFDGKATVYGKKGDFSSNAAPPGEEETILLGGIG